VAALNTVIRPFSWLPTLSAKNSGDCSTDSPNGYPEGSIVYLTVPNPENSRRRNIQMMANVNDPPQTTVVMIGPDVCLLSPARPSIISPPKIDACSAV
jgi:hypothetical protein